jgi:hypothetical protein
MTAQPSPKSLVIAIPHTPTLPLYANKLSTCIVRVAWVISIRTWDAFSYCRLS